MRITIPDMGVDHASVAEILVQVGDVVTAEQSLLLLESDKAAVEVPSPQAGRIAAILLKVGAQVQQGDAAFELVTDEENAAADSAESNKTLAQSSTSRSALAAASEQNLEQKSSAQQATMQQATMQQAKVQQATVQQANLDLEDSTFVTPSTTIKHQTANAETKTESQSNPNSKPNSKQNPSQTSSALMDVQVPDIGVEKAVVSEIMVKVGDLITVEQSIVLLESDKASVEVPSPVAGTVAAILVKTGDSVKEGVVLLQLGTDSASSVTQAQPTSAQLTSAQPTSAQQDPESSATANTSAEVAIAVQAQPETTPDESALTGQKPATQQSDPTPSAVSVPLSAAQQADNAQVHAGPAVRQLARQLGVALREVAATGAHDRIVKEDVFAYVKTRLAKVQPTSKASEGNNIANTLPALPNFDAYGGGEWKTLTRLQQVSIPQLSLNTHIPQVTQFDLADITELDAWRESLKAEYKAQGVSLTILAFIAKAVAYLLKKEPYFAAHLSDDGQSVLLRHDIHMGIAVATPDGLTVPVLRHPEQKSIAQIANELMVLSQKARDKKLSPKELQGANFSITSLGSIGGTAFTPLVNWPQVAILGISPARIQPEWDGTQFVPRLMLPLSLSYDHRVINGADAARFCHQLTLILQDIRQILL